MKNDGSRTQNSILNMVSGFSLQIITILLNFITRSVFIKTLGVSYLGINGLFSDILSLLSIAELGFDTAISYRLYKPIAERDARKVRQYMILFKVIYRWVGVIILVLGLLVIPFLRYLIKDYDSLGALGINAATIFLLFLIQNVSTYLFMAYRSVVVKASQKQHLLDFVNFGLTIVYNIAKIIVLLLTNSFIAYIFTTTAYYIIKNLVNAYYSTRKYPQYFSREETSLSREEKRELFQDCGALFVFKVNNVVIKATDNIVLSTFVGLEIVGLYSNYLVIYQAIFSVLQIMFRSVKASIGNLFASDDVPKKYLFFEIMNYVAVIFFGTAAVGFAVIANEFIELWIGAEYVIPQPLPILIGIELFFAGLKLNLAQIRNVSGIFKQMWFRPVIGSVINLVSSVILVHYLEISGVIIGTILAALFANFLVDPRVIHKYGFQNYKSSGYYYRKNVIFFLLLGAVGTLDYYICTYLFIGHGIFSLLVHILICALSIPTAFSLAYRKSPEFQYIKNFCLGAFRKVFHRK